MNALLDPLRRVVRDLVRKKLWPVAALLLVAIVAVPVVIGASSEDAPAPVPVAPAAPGAGGTKSLVTVVDQAVTGKDGRPGRIGDPFYDPLEPPAAAPSGGAVPTGPATGGTPSDPPAGTPDPPAGTPDPPAGTPDPPAETTPTAPAAPAPAYFRTVVRWHEAAGGAPHPIARLTPFGELADPAALYLGVTGSVRGATATAYAMFLLGANATSEGEGECEDETSCRIIGLQAGESRIVSVQPRDGSAARRFSLDLVSVERVKAGPAQARKMRAKVHSGGRDVMREMWQDAATAAALRSLRYSQALGLLYTTGAEKAAR